ncbi:DsbA family protein [Candidatus Pacearchaeota archaeon]|nr:DsbA family protein [Candidatus Pacearchaeota archaeon]
MPRRKKDNGLKENPEQVNKEEVIEIPVGEYFSWAKNNPWRVMTVLLALILLGVIIFNPLGSSSSVSADKAGKNIISFINSNPNIEGEATLVSVEKDGSFYQATVNFQGQNLPVYLTLDGEYLLTGRPVSLDEQIPLIENTQTPPPSLEAIEVEEGNDASLGDENAPVTIVEFSDYQCPFCQRFWKDTLPKIKETYIETGKVNFIYKDFPLSIHPQAQIAAEASECVRSKGRDEKFWKFHDKIFENQQSLSEENLKAWAKELGTDITTCLKNGQFKDEVQEDFTYGSSIGVSGTPAFFINGILVEGAQPFEVFEQIIEEELAAE